MCAHQIAVPKYVRQKRIELSGETDKFTMIIVDVNTHLDKNC
jgi:hypothetical protein